MKYLYSAKHNAFFPVPLLQIYIDAGWDLSDGLEVSEEVFIEFTSAPPYGKARGHGTDGYPWWVELPPS